MADRLTDEQVRALLNGATPGPWHPVYTDDADHMCAMYLGTTDRGDSHDNQCGMAPSADRADEVIAIVLLQSPLLAAHASDRWDENLALLAAAPDLAADLLAARAALQRLRDHAEPLSWLMDGLGQKPSSALLDDARRVWLEVGVREPRTVTMLDEARRGRDEARAEVERLRGERARIVAWLRTEPETGAQCDGHRHAGKPCRVLRELTLTEAADAIERGEHEEG